MRFQYAFQKIVDLKSNERTQAEWYLSEAIGRLQQEENSLNELRSVKENVQSELITVSAQKATISQLMVMHQYVEHIESKISVKHQDVQVAQQVVQTQQEHLTDKMLQEKVWTKAKEKAFNHFTATLLYKEQQELDEMATNRFQRT